MIGDDLAVWSALLAEHPVADVHALPLGWAAWQVAHPGAGRVVIARDGDRPVALAALAAARLPWKRLHARALQSAGDVHWRCGPALTGRDVGHGAEALLAALADAGGWDVLALGPMPADDEAPAALVAAGAHRGMRPRVDEVGRAPRVAIAGAWRDYLASRSANLRHAIARGAKRLARRGPVALDELRGGDGLAAALAAFYRVEASGWKGEGGTAITSSPATHAFYDALAREAAAAGALRLYLLRVGDEVVAGDLALAHRGVVYALKTGYDATLADASPGLVLRARILERVWAAGDVVAFDLGTGGGDHAGYKQRWATGARAYVEVRLHHPRSARGQALAGLHLLRQTVDAVRADGRTP